MKWREIDCSKISKEIVNIFAEYECPIFLAKDILESTKEALEYQVVSNRDNELPLAVSNIPVGDIDKPVKFNGEVTTTCFNDIYVELNEHIRSKFMGKENTASVRKELASEIVHLMKPLIEIRDVDVTIEKDGNIRVHFVDPR